MNLEPGTGGVVVRVGRVALRKVAELRINGSGRWISGIQPNHCQNDIRG